MNDTLTTMDPPPKTHNLTLLTTAPLLKETLRALLQTIFFHRFFTAVRPHDRDVLGLTLPCVDDAALDTLINDRAAQLLRHLERANGPTPHASLHIDFLEKRRRKTYTFFGPKADESVCWERWRLDVSMLANTRGVEGERVMERVEASLRDAAMAVMEIAGREKEHIPVITTADANPFPYEITLGE